LFPIQALLVFELILEGLNKTEEETIDYWLGGKKKKKEKRKTSRGSNIP